MTHRTIDKSPSKYCEDILGLWTKLKNYSKTISVFPYEIIVGTTALLKSDIVFDIGNYFTAKNK